MPGSPHLLLPPEHHAVVPHQHERRGPQDADKGLLDPVVEDGRDGRGEREQRARPRLGVIGLGLDRAEEGGGGTGLVRLERLVEEEAVEVGLHVWGAPL